jgi:hypothetical protein
MFKICQTRDRAEIDRINEIQKEYDPLKPNIKLFNYFNERNFRDVHMYDMKGERIDLPSVRIEEALPIINHLKTLLINQASINMLDIISNRANFDPTNQVDSKDILVWICTHYISIDLFFLLEEQLADNGSLGTCLQGSSHRLRQIYYAMLPLQGPLP